jgi:putative peptidoglycan lipid II flippase
LAWSGAVVVGSQWVAYAAGIRWSNVYGGEGSALVFVLAWTLFLLPWSVLALPIATSTFPRLSALHERNDADGAARATAVSLRAVITVSAIGAAGLAAAAEPLAAIMVEGAPGRDVVPELAAMLTALAPGVLAYGAHGHLVRVLAAGHHAPLAAAGTVVGWVVGLLTAAVGVRVAEGATDVARAIGLGFSVGLVVSAVLLAIAVAREDGRDAVARAPLVTVVAGAAAVCVGWVGHVLLVGTEGGSSIATAIGQTLVVGVVAAAVVGAAAVVVDPDSARALVRLKARSPVAVVDE